MDFTLSNEPYALFSQWLSEAEKSEINDPNAASLATVDSDGMPNVRVVLLKDVDERGFVFYTNFNSAKGQEVQGAMKVAMGFHWKSLRRQVRVRGAVELVSDAEADSYYNSRHPLSRLGAWASDQSKPLENRQVLMDRVQEFREKYGEDNIPRPSHWSGFRIIPSQIEFWQDGEFRLHDRIVFEPNGGAWDKQRLYP